jgi:hypothetical protein
LFLREERQSIFRQAEQERTTHHSGKRSEGEIYSSVAEKKKARRLSGLGIGCSYSKGRVHLLGILFRKRSNSAVVPGYPVREANMFS